MSRSRRRTSNAGDKCKPGIQRSATCMARTTRERTSIQMTNEQWRVGHSYDIHVYSVGPTSPDGDRPVATFHQPHDAHRAVRLVNSPTTTTTEADIVQRICALERAV